MLYKINKKKWIVVNCLNNQVVDIKYYIKIIIYYYIITIYNIIYVIL